MFLTESNNARSSSVKISSLFTYLEVVIPSDLKVAHVAVVISLINHTTCQHKMLIKVRTLPYILFDFKTHT